MVAQYSLFSNRLERLAAHLPPDQPITVSHPALHKWLEFYLQREVPLQDPEDPSLHLFAPRLLECMPAMLYYLSPCASFWTDEGPGELETQPLLLSWGRRAQRMGRWLEERGAPTETDYALRESVAALPGYAELWHKEIALEGGEASLLQRLQADLLLFHTPGTLFGDASVRLYHAASLHGEVKQAVRLIREALEQGKSPQEISLLAPSPERVRPYLKTYKLPIDVEELASYPPLPVKCLYLIGLTEGAIDAACFLEHFLSARESLFLSTHGTPAPFLLDLLSYLSRFYGIHPLEREARATLPLASAPSLFETLQKKAPLSPGRHRLSLQSLRRTLRDPLAAYLKKSCNLSFKPKEEAALSYRTLGQVRRASLRGETPSLSLMPGVWGEVDARRIARECREVADLFEETGLSPPLLETLELEKLTVVLSEETTVELTGKMESLLVDGIFSPRPPSLKEAITLWPLCLILQKLGRLKKVLFETQAKEWFEAPETTLQGLLAYYFEAHTSPSLLLPEWVGPILKGDAAALQRAMEERAAMRGEEDATTWFLRTHPLSPEEILAREGERAHVLYGLLAEKWNFI